MNTPNNAAALERLELISREMRERRVNHGKHTSPTLVAWAARIDAELATLRATLAQPDALTSQPSEVKRWQPSSFMEPGRSHVYARMQESDHGAFVLFDDYQKLLNSQPSGEAVAARLTVYADTKAITARIHDVAHSLAPGTYDLYTHPSADAPVVNSSLRVAALALADLAERNTDDLDLWQAAIAAVRNAAGAAVTDATVERAAIALHDFRRQGNFVSYWDNMFPEYKDRLRDEIRTVITALAPKPEGGHG